MDDTEFPHILDILTICKDENSAIQFLLAEEIIKIPEKCVFCDNERVVVKEEPFLMRCKDCRKVWSALRNTFFEGAKLPMHLILLLGYLWLAKCTYSSIYTMLNGIASETVTTWTQYYYDLIYDDMENIETKIGGPNVIVEIDESKFGKRQFNKGHRVTGVWVVGGVERTPERRMFALKVEDRTATTLNDIIEAYVEPGSIVFTDGWAGYRHEDLDALQIAHGVVNHSENFVDHETGIHTNTIEGTWSGIKQHVPKRKRTKEFVEGHLMRFIWERRFKGVQWRRLLNAMKTVRYITKNNANENL